MLNTDPNTYSGMANQFCAHCGKQVYDDCPVIPLEGFEDSACYECWMRFQKDSHEPSSAAIEVLRETLLMDNIAYLRAHGCDAAADKLSELIDNKGDLK